VSARRRLDLELVRRGLATSRAEAAEAVEAGKVLVGGAPAAKPARLVAAHEPITVAGERPRFVSRGGRKLDGALERFGLDVSGVRALDAGASTGGFTDCLLQRGAAWVVAVDVGYGQLHEKLVADPRVVVIDRTNVRDLTVAAIGGVVDFVVADLSFISLTKVTDALLRVCRPGAELVLLVKPQFEAGRREVGRGGGVIRDEAVRAEVRATIDDHLRAKDAGIMGWMDSTLPGADGNVEFFVHARKAES
jgi:23S rRNA (cytidine1920-2'-O)/16S rRNA (cytidine1409-2'-O)-methyltransferase